MPALSSKAPTLLSSTVVDMKTLANTALFTVPVGKVLRIAYIVVRDPTATCAGATSNSVTNFVQTFSIATLVTALTGYITIGPIMQITTTAPAQYVESAAGVVINWTVNSPGSTGVASATVDVFGTLL